MLSRSVHLNYPSPVQEKSAAVVIILDGLQHMKESGLRWLPTKLPRDVHMIVSTTSAASDGGLDSNAYAAQMQLKTQQIYNEIRRRSWLMLEMNPRCEESLQCGSAGDMLMLNGGHVVNNSLMLLFVSRHGLHEDELIHLLARMTNNGTSILCDEEKELHLEELSSIGVVTLGTKLGRLFTLPINNPTLRNAVWDTLIMTTRRETEVRSLVVEYFQSKDPSLRNCEELPWQQTKLQCPNLARTLVDLRVVDIMYNTEELRNELYTYLSGLVLTNSFDIVSNFNRAIQKWNKKCKPTSTQIAMMTTFLGNVVLWFSRNISHHSDMPSFIRDSIQVDHLLCGADETGVLQSFSSTTCFYYRWVWCNWPWIALRLAPNSLKEAADTSLKETADTTPSTAKNVNECGDRDVIPPASAVREKALTRAATLPVHLLTKLEKITSDDSQSHKKTSTTVVIPHSPSRRSNKIQEEVPRTSRVDSSEQRVRDAKHLLDALKVEKRKSMQTLQMLQVDQKLDNVALTSLTQNKEQQESVLDDLRSRYRKVTDLFEQAVNIESSFNDILAALEMYDPAKLNYQHLEHQIAQSKQELSELRNERTMHVERINQARKETMSVKTLINSALQDRQNIEPVLTSLRCQVKEIEERKKSELVKKFNPSSFSKRVQLVGKIAKRRQDKLKRIAIAPQLAAEQQHIIDHPMMKLIETCGTKDVEEIKVKLETLNEDSESLRSRQESVELRLKVQLSELEHIQCQMEQLDLACCADKHAPTQFECSDLQGRKDRLTSISNLTSNVNVALVHLEQKASQCAGLNFVLMNEGDSSLYRDAKNVAEVVSKLCKDFVSASYSQVNESPIKYKNIRVLNKAEAELLSTFSLA